MSFSEEDVLATAVQYFGGDELAASVWTSKYALRNQSGALLEMSPDEMHRRIAKEFARIESKYLNGMSEDEIFDLLKEFKYIVPQGSPMSGIGNPHQMQSLANCFVIPSPQDSIGAIARTDEEEAQIMKRRGGVGFDISNIRPRGVTTANAARTTDGIGVFMEKFSNTCRGIAQGGRRGALMLTIDCRHPEIETFINIKRDLTKVTGANVSVKVTDDFMRAVESDSEFILQWPVNVPLADAKVTKTVKAKEIWNQMMDAAHTSAEPGILFWDTITRESPSDAYSSVGFASVSTNPCVTGDTLVVTLEGIKTVKELSDSNKKFEVESYNHKTGEIIKTQATAFKTKENAEILKLKLKNGQQLRLTADHQVYTDSGWKKAGELTKADKVLALKK